MPSPSRVVVLDYGFGNVRSAVRALEQVGAQVELTADRRTAEDADGLVVPGVGAFEACMTGLRAVRGDQVIDRRLAGGRPVLGICVGMQVMFGEGVEHGRRTEGLGEWPGTVEPLVAPVVPHMGWNTVEVPEGSRLFAGLEDARFYFVHSYGVQRWEARRQRVAAAGAAGHLVRPRRSGSSPRSRTVRCRRRSSTPRSPATPGWSCSAPGWGRCREAAVVTGIPR